MKNGVFSLFGLLNGRKNSGMSKRTTLRVESLEDRQLLSATPYEPAGDAQAAVAMESIIPAFPTGADVVQFNLADYAGYSNFRLSHNQWLDTIVLRGMEADGTFTWLGTSVAGIKNVNVIGQANLTENLFVTNAAMENLTTINFAGGGFDCLLHRDTLTIVGTLGDDHYIIDNGFGLVGNYNVFGTGRITRENVAAGTLQATVNFVGVGNAVIDGFGGNDTYHIDGLSTYVNLTTGSGTDTIDFQNARVINNNVAGVVLNMGATYRQAAIVGQIGFLQLTGEFENVNLSTAVDTVYGNAANNVITDTSASYNVVYITQGGDDTVNLAGKASVVVGGNGVNAVTVGGNYSVVNLALTGPASVNTVNAVASGVAVVGGYGVDTVNITGDYASVNLALGALSNVSIAGNHATVITGAGNDWVWVNGNFANINTGAGDDLVRIAGSNGSVFTGEGDDTISLEDRWGWVGGAWTWISAAANNILKGGNGDNYMVGKYATGNGNYWYGGTGNDIIIGSQGNDYIYGVAGNNIIFGVGGANQIFGGTGRDILVANLTTNTAGLLGWTAGATRTYFTGLQTDWLLNTTAGRDAVKLALGANSVRMAGAGQSFLYRGAGTGNLFYANKADFNNAIFTAPFLDELFV